jgi:uncharacterized membrane protein YfcA
LKVDPALTAWMFAASLGAAALGGALGMASGIFIVPILTTFGHLDIHAAIVASIVSVIACSCGGAAPLLRNGTTNIRLAVVLEVATTLGALSGLLLVGLVSVSTLYVLFAGVLFVSAWQMAKRRTDSSIQQTGARTDRWANYLRLHSTYIDTKSRQEVVYRVRHVPLGLTLMYGAGMLSALLGIGSGVLKIPAMDSALRLPIKVSSATSNFMIGVTAAASGIAHLTRGDIDLKVTAPVALGSVVGAMLGTRVLTAVSAKALRVFFVLVLLGLAVQMALTALGVDVVRLAT